METPTLNEETKNEEIIPDNQEESSTTEENTDEKTESLEENIKNIEKEDPDLAAEIKETIAPNNTNKTQKRIIGLVKEKHQKNRRINELENELKSVINRLDKKDYEDNQKKSDNEINDLKVKLKDAIELNDVEKQVDIQSNMSEVVARKNQKFQSNNEELANPQDVQNYMAKNFDFFNKNQMMTQQAIGYAHQVEQNPEYSHWSNKQKLDHVGKTIKEWNTNRDEIPPASPTMGATSKRSSAEGNVTQEDISGLRRFHPTLSDQKLREKHLSNIKKYGNE